MIIVLTLISRKYMYSSGLNFYNLWNRAWCTCVIRINYLYLIFNRSIILPWRYNYPLEISIIYESCGRKSANRVHKVEVRFALLSMSRYRFWRNRCFTIIDILCAVPCHIFNLSIENFCSRKDRLDRQLFRYRGRNRGIDRYYSMLHWDYRECALRK